MSVQSLPVVGKLTSQSLNLFICKIGVMTAPLHGTRRCLRGDSCHPPPFSQSGVSNGVRKDTIWVSDRQLRRGEKMMHQESIGGEVRLDPQAGPAMSFAGPQHNDNAGAMIQTLLRISRW